MVPADHRNIPVFQNTLPCCNKSAAPFGSGFSTNLCTGRAFSPFRLGGPATLVGPALGAAAIVLLKNVMSAYTARWLLILGIVYIVAILAAPKGVWNLGRGR